MMNRDALEQNLKALMTDRINSFVKTLKFVNEENRAEYIECIKTLSGMALTIGHYLQICPEKMSFHDAMLMAMNSKGLDIHEDEDGHTAVYKDGERV